MRLFQFSLGSLLILMCLSAIGFRAVRAQQVQHQRWYQIFCELQFRQALCLADNLREVSIPPPPKFQDVWAWWNYRDQVAQIQGINLFSKTTPELLIQVAQLPGVT